ncbi:MAG TPA: T9SS type A sorting domain-containing protein [Ferruginibacter sp.]|nr:T9SS type A sorting domain-containing protein [Ferruginibacter sp.]
MSTLQASAISVSGTYYIKYVKGSCSSTKPVVVSVNGSGTLAGNTISAVCSNNTVSASGTVYSDASCNLIAKVLPSGGSPVSGTINTCVTLDATQQYFNARPYVQRHVDIEPAVSDITTTSATITLYFTNAEFVAYNTNNPLWPQLPTVAGGGSTDPNRLNLRVTQYHGTATTTPSSPGYYTGNAGNGVLITPSPANITWNGLYWSVTFNVTGFSGFYVHSVIVGGGPLAVNLNYLNGVKQGDNNLLNWSVSCTNTPRAVLTLERSVDARSFSSIYSITADALRCQQPFAYTDAQPMPGLNYYRLKMMDADGKIGYSNTIALLHATKGFELVSVAPNPVINGRLNLNVAAAQSSKINIVITDMLGRTVKSESTTLSPGSNNIQLKVDQLQAGTYNISASSSDQKGRVLRFVKE